MQPESHRVALTTNSADLEEEVRSMARGITLQETSGRGAQRQCGKDMSWTLDAATVTSPSTPMYCGDTTGEPRGVGEVRKAGQLEIDYFPQTEVYDKVTNQRAREAGQQILGARWVDVRKTDGMYRSRLLAKDLRTDEVPELFAATPPIESLKYLMRKAAQDSSTTVMHMDVARVHFYAQASRDIFVRLPHENQLEGDKHLREALKKAMYGTRDDAQNWQKMFSETARQLAFIVGKASPCHFHHDLRVGSR